MTKTVSKSIVDAQEIYGYGSSQTYSLIKKPN